MSPEDDAAPPAATITPDQVLETLGRVRSGQVFDLSVAIAAGWSPVAANSLTI